MRPHIAFAETSPKNIRVIRIGMRESWPHAPPHYFTPGGVYLITAATLHRKPLFHSDEKLDLLRDTTFELAKNYALILQAWAFFANHYHIVVSFENSTTKHGDFLRHLHRELAIRLNDIDSAPGRRVMYEFWDTHLTFEKSWARAVELRPSKRGEAWLGPTSESVSLVFSALV